MTKILRSLQTDNIQFVETDYEIHWLDDQSQQPGVKGWGTQCLRLQGFRFEVSTVSPVNHPAIELPSSTSVFPLIPHGILNQIISKSKSENDQMMNNQQVFHGIKCSGRYLFIFAVSNNDWNDIKKSQILLHKEQTGYLINTCLNQKTWVQTTFACHNVAELLAYFSTWCRTWSNAAWHVLQLLEMSK